MLSEIKILSQHGKQYIKRLDKAVLPELFRGKPEIQNNLTSDEITDLVELCPTGAIVDNPFSINIGKCVFCKECEFCSNGKIKFTNDYHLAANNPHDLIIQAGDNSPIQLDPNKVRAEIRSYFNRALKLRQVSAGGDNSTEMELNASGNVNFDFGRYGIEFLASPRHCDGIVITGPISENMAKPLEICYKAIPKPKIVILAGTDAISGGIYADSPAINRRFLDKYPVDLYLPGNPVHPLTFIHGVLNLIGRKF